jgi:hypothetical protein
MFARGLPRGLADSCIDQDSPESFEQWSSSAQMQQKNWMKKKSLRDESEKPKLGQGQGRNLPPWRRNAGANSGGKPRLPPIDPDAMDTSAAARKAVTEQDKEKHRAEGRCYQCSKRGHLARDCPDKKTRVRATQEDAEEAPPKPPPKEKKEKAEKPVQVKELAALIKKLGEEDYDALMANMAEDEGFVDA